MLLNKPRIAGASIRSGFQIQFLLSYVARSAMGNTDY